jgi:hypothetical protein
LRGGGKDADTVALERRVTDALGLEVTVDHRGEAGVVHGRGEDGISDPRLRPSAYQPARIVFLAPS